MKIIFGLIITIIGIVLMYAFFGADGPIFFLILGAILVFGGGHVLAKAFGIIE